MRCSGLRAEFATLFVEGAPFPGLSAVLPDATHSTLTFLLSGLPRPLSDVPALAVSSPGLRPRRKSVHQSPLTTTQVSVRIQGITSNAATLHVAPPALAARFAVSVVDTAATACSARGAEVLSISGAGFGTDAGAVRVAIGSAACVVCGFSDTSLVCATNATSGERSRSCAEFAWWSIACRAGALTVSRGALVSGAVPYSLDALLAAPAIVAVQVWAQ